MNDAIMEALRDLAAAMDTVILHNKPMQPSDLRSRRQLVENAERLLAEWDAAGGAA